MDITYQSMVYDDLHHLMKIHQHEIQRIMELAITKYKMKGCDLSECEWSDRHFRILTNQSETNNDDDQKYYNLHKETMETQNSTNSYQDSKEFLM